ncbi:MAG: hypothetical protein GX221_05960 [Candidatus Riflebacteria bacterium]|nr:hypothetical protein [Candidatus Riflebacteria bacterium]
MVERVKKVFFNFLDTQKIPYKEENPEVWLAEPPKDKQSLLNGAEEFRFTFNKNIAELHRNIEYISENSYSFRKVVEKISSEPKAAKVRLKTDGNAKGIKWTEDAVFNFKVSMVGGNVKDMLFHTVCDLGAKTIELNEGLFAPEKEKYIDCSKDSNSKASSPTEILRYYLMSCNNLETYLLNEIKEKSKSAENKYKEELAAYNTYLDEEKKELETKKDNSGFHLYFFQKEEEIDKMISNLEKDRKEKTAELREKFKLKTKISLISAIIIERPEKPANKTGNLKLVKP